MQSLPGSELPVCGNLFFLLLLSRENIACLVQVREALKKQVTSGTVPLSRPADLPFHMSAKYKARIKKTVFKPFYTVRAKSRMELNNCVS